MDSELKSLTLNTSQLAALSGVHRQTVAARLKNVIPSGGNDSNLKLYGLTNVLAELMKMPAPIAEGEMEPQDRKAWYQSERERLKFEQEVGELIPASDVAREFGSMAKAMVQVLETLPDILERDYALTPDAVNRVQAIIDDLRDEIARRVTSDDKAEEDIPEEG
jgi:phage terminase Nu1 subunit (DNA packaging protein)